ncbi:hypothetical protein QFZ33_004403 [Arthrobacter globiformis]|nr:hypothetical protein [Arthrobacter globiformis]
MPRDAQMAGRYGIRASPDHLRVAGQDRRRTLSTTKDRNENMGTIAREEGVLPCWI